MDAGGGRCSPFFKLKGRGKMIDIKLASLFFAGILLLMPLAVSFYFRLGLIREMAFAFLRMLVQLVLIGFFMQYLFYKNNMVLNLLWFALMIIVAVFSVVKRASVDLRKVFLPSLLSFSISVGVIVLFINFFVLRLDYVFDARYLIVLGGLLLGNSMRGNIVAINSFYDGLRRDYKRYLYLLACGATVSEATLPLLRKSIKLALQPTLAAMATMGIVSLPGMMTGVILGGAGPMVAIKYQIMIMIGILSATVFSVVLTIVLSRKNYFDKAGRLIIPD